MCLISPPPQLPVEQLRTPSGGMRKGNKGIAAVARTVQRRKPAHLPSGGTEYRLPILERTQSGNFIPTPILGIQYTVVTSAGGYGIRVLAIR